MQIFENVGIHNHMIQQNRSVGVIIYKTKMSLSKHSHQGSRVRVEKVTDDSKEEKEER